MLKSTILWIYMHIAMIGQKGLPVAEAATRGKAHLAGGGIERHVQELATRLVQSRHTVSVYSRRWFTDQADTQDHQGISVTRLPSVKTKHLDTASHTLFATLHALIKERPDVIHYHGVGPSLFAWIPRIFSPHTIVINTFHCIDRHHEKWGVLARLALRLGEWTACAFSHRTIVVSRALEAYVASTYRSLPTYIPNGTTLRDTPVSAAPLEQFGLTTGEYLLSVCRLIPHKGTAELIDAYRALSQDARKGKKLVIVGDGHYTDAYVAAIRAAAAKDSDIILTGFQAGETLASLYAHAYAFVHPSRSEGMPLAVLDAMGAKLPVLLSDIPEHRELGVGDRSLYRLDEQGALLLSLARLLQEPPAILSERAEQNRAIVQSDYDWDRITKDTIALYASALYSQTIRKTFLRGISS